MLNSSTTTEADVFAPIHPGESLMEEYIDGFGITQNKLAVSIGVPPRWSLSARGGALFKHRGRSVDALEA